MTARRRRKPARCTVCTAVVAPLCRWSGSSACVTLTVVESLGGRTNATQDVSVV